MAEYGYIRVSSADQNEARQLAAMQAAGIPEWAVVVDKQSGKDFDRRGYNYLCRKMKRGDTIVIKSIDRLGRDYDGVIEQWRALTQRGIGIRVLDMPVLDTSRDRDLTGRLIADIVLQLLSYVAQTEREFIHQRQAEGIAAAKQRGVHFGRKAMDRPPGLRHWKKMYENRLVTSREAAAALGVSHTTFLRWAKEG